MESSNVVFIETPSQLIPPSTEESSVQVSGNEGVNNDNNSHNYATDDFVRDLRNYTSMTHLPPGPSVGHVTASECTENPQVTELLGRISEVTWRDTLQKGASRSAQEESVSEGAPHFLPSASSDKTSAGALQDDGTDSPKMPPLDGSLHLRQHGHVRRKVTPSVTHLGAAARAVARRNASHSSQSGHLVMIATRHTLSELRRLDLYIKRFLPDIAHQTCEQESTGEYAYAATDISNARRGRRCK